MTQDAKRKVEGGREVPSRGGEPSQLRELINSQVYAAQHRGLNQDLWVEVRGRQL